MRKNIAIVSGGDSGEFEISVQSGQIVKKYLDPNLYSVYPILMKGDHWYYECKNDNRYTIDKNDFSFDFDGDTVKFDCVFIAIHGTPGEDGKLQGYFDMLGIPYTTCNHTTSALTFNKYFCKNYLQSFNVNMAKSVHLIKNVEYNVGDIINVVSLPAFIKPNNGGSSVGMSKVHKKEEFIPAIEKAFKEDEEIIIEEFIKGREITCGLFKSNNKITVLPVAEIIPKNEYFDFEAKYSEDMAEEVVPAAIPIEVEQECKVISQKLYEKLNCKGVVRFDYIFNNNGLYFLEVNTVPGLTEASIVPKMAYAHGLSLTELFSTLVNESLNQKN